MTSKQAEFVERDLKYIWHPFTQMKDYEKNIPPTIIHKGKGIYVWDLDGNKYIDGISSWWVNTLGHSNPRLNNALKTQADTLEHVMLAGFSHVPAIELAEKLINLMPDELTKVFYSDNGSTAVEVALKMAYQYWVIKNQPQKNKFIALKNSYHGDTIGSVSVGGIDLFHSIYRPLLFETYQADSPYCYRCPENNSNKDCDFKCVDSVKQILVQNSDSIAGVMITSCSGCCWNDYL